MKLSYAITGALLASSLAFTVQAHNHKSTADIVDTAVAAGSFTTLVTAVDVHATDAYVIITYDRTRT